MAGVCAVVGCGPGMGGSAAIRFAKAGYKIAGMCRTADSFVPTQDGCGKDQVPSADFFFQSVGAIFLILYHFYLHQILTFRRSLKQLAPTLDSTR